MRRLPAVLAMVVLLAAVSPTPFGGWMVLSVQELPEFLEAGKPIALSFKIRQHGQKPVRGLKPVVTLWKADRRGSPDWLWYDRSALVGGVRAVEGGAAGLYSATITPTEPGRVSIVIDTDFHGSWKVRLLPLHVVAAGGRPPTLSPHERGRQLFVAKGCLTCHTKTDEPTFGGWKGSMGSEGDLTGLSFVEEALARKLADPALFRVAASNGDFVMPKIALGDQEIGALVSFLIRGEAGAPGSEGR